MAKLIGGVLGGIIALLGLVFASKASDSGVYYAGLLIFVVGVAYAFYQLKRGLDDLEPTWAQQAKASGAAKSGGSGGKTAAKTGSGTASKRSSGSKSKASSGRKANA